MIDTNIFYLKRCRIQFVALLFIAISKECSQLLLQLYILADFLAAHQGGTYVVRLS